jgi:hypothetical protein
VRRKCGLGFHVRFVREKKVENVEPLGLEVLPFIDDQASKRRSAGMVSAITRS